MRLGKRELLARTLALARFPVLYLGLISMAERVTVLAYHRVCELRSEDEFPYDLELVSATPEDFSWQMEFVRQHFDIITFERLIDSIERGSRLRRRAAIVTFDDGHRDNYEQAFPVLRRLGIPATIFLSTGYIGGQGTFWFDRVAYLLYHAPGGKLSVPDIAFDADLRDVRTRRAAAGRLLQLLKRLRNDERLDILRQLERLVPLESHDDSGKSGALDWHQVREMSEAGIEFGSHAITHPVLTALEDDALGHELSESRRVIEQETGKTCNVLAYPVGSGARDQRVIAAARRNGYKLGVGYGPGTNYLPRLETFAIRRLHVERYTSRAFFQSMLAIPEIFGWR